MNKIEKFALSMSVLLYQVRIKDINNSPIFDDEDKPIPVDFIDKILNDDSHVETIKEQLRMSVLEDVTQNPDNYDMREDTFVYNDIYRDTFVYSGNIYNHAYLVDNYVKVLYADTQTKTVYLCTYCNSDNVQVKSWTLPNQGHKFVDEVNEGDEMGWCNDCNLITFIEIAELKKRAEVIGFQVVGEDDTKEEGKFHPHMNNNMCLYNLDQAKSMMDDTNNGDEQWRLLSVWTNDIEKPTMMFDIQDGAVLIPVPELKTRIWGEIRNNFQEDDIVHIDAFLTDDDNEEGQVIAKVNVQTKEVEYLDDRARTDSYAQEMIDEILI